MRGRVIKSTATIGVRLNLFITINYDLTITGVDLFDELRNERVCQWLRTRGKALGVKFEPTYLFVREAGHVHWCLHVPEPLIPEFLDLLPRWVTSLEHKGSETRIRAVNHAPAPKGVVDVRRIYNSPSLCKYMLKGIESEHAARFGVKDVSDQGLVVGRRTGCSRNIGRTARKRAGYKPLRYFKRYKKPCVEALPASLISAYY